MKGKRPRIKVFKGKKGEFQTHQGSTYNVISHVPKKKGKKSN